MAIDVAREHLNEWLKAELTVATNQSYTIGTRTLTRASLDAIRREIEFWQDQVSRLENLANGHGRNRAYRVIPRDF